MERLWHFVAEAVLIQSGCFGVERRSDNGAAISHAVVGTIDFTSRNPVQGDRAVGLRSYCSFNLGLRGEFPSWQQAEPGR
jgi:hypothetical protein